MESHAALVDDLLVGVVNPPETFEEYLSSYAQVVGDLVNDFIPSGSHDGMDDYLYAPLLGYSRNGGKRHRPLICLAACVAVGGDVRRAVSSAAAIEHFHTAALIHDDIADEATLRRGEPCLHLTQGLGLAINMGDLGLSLVNGTVVRDPLLEDGVKVRVIAELIEMTRRTIEGQALDLGWARDERYDITPEDYLVMATHKTAHYSGAVPLAVGAIVGGGSEAEIEGLRAYGLDTGLAFQIQDDLLNIEGDPAVVGKDFCSDITEGKRTLMVVHALQNSADRGRLVDILSAKTTDADTLREAVAIMRASGSIDYARAYAEDLTNIAKDRLVGLIGPSPARSLLISMADYFVNRLK
ncbi:polyprenyl synthetase family protein [Slackia exigua]|uniref:polyprenyl synthetase family protein n=1 Tax=Slackia exigua TaxID=84109 RepID=UPI00254B8D98|nr:polyprenyl synthetase family protein [Slackia exigua]MDK7724167.1 polyprenyl synthetase family protein [Slackia exigua]MDK7726097.1 polyprenyl synthetase family protein [Slackia exigua]